VIPKETRARLALAWFFVLTLAAVFAPLWLSGKAQEMDFRRVLEAPSAACWLGTDSLGRDLLARLLCGAAVSLGVGFAAVLIAVAAGTLVGALAGYYGGWRDRVLMGCTDVMLCFPTFFLILGVIAVLGPNILNIMVIIGATSWMGTARLVRAEVLSLKERDFVLAARALGASDACILKDHLIPNAAGPIIVNAVLGLSAAILVESGLSFLGIGVQPPVPSWGNILIDGQATLGVAWWLTLFPGLAILFTVLAANVLGESLHDALKGDSR